MAPLRPRDDTTLPSRDDFACRRPIAPGTEASDRAPADPFGELTFENLSEPPRRFLVRGAGGKLLAVLVRTADKAMWWLGHDGRPGLGGLHPSHFLYGVERLSRVPLDVPVVICEGPKDTEACWRAGFVAVGTLTGAGGVPSTSALKLMGDRIVVLWPDADPAGRDHMERVAEALIGIAREIRLVDVSGLPAKAGAADVPLAEIPHLVARARVVRACAEARVGKKSTVEGGRR
jgi:5S rRNA maturation endonuclease (ribonuclease M5)